MILQNYNPKQYYILRAFKKNYMEIVNLDQR